MSPPKNTKQFATNRQARFNYHILDKYVAGIVLRGPEVKSIRGGKLNIKDSFVRFDRLGELWLINTHVSPYQGGTQASIDPTRKRKLLLTKRELGKLASEAKAKGLTMVPLAVFDSHGKIKVEIALVKGKKLYDKREDRKQADLKREAQREAKSINVKF